jgi:hypothetical protein
MREQTVKPMSIPWPTGFAHPLGTPAIATASAHGRAIFKPGISANGCAAERRRRMSCFKEIDFAAVQMVHGADDFDVLFIFETF